MVVIVIAIGLFVTDMSSLACWSLIGFNLFSVFLTAIFEKCPACNRRTPGLSENWFGKQRRICRYCEAILLNPDGTIFKG